MQRSPRSLLATIPLSASVTLAKIMLFGNAKACKSSFDFTGFVELQNSTNLEATSYPHAVNTSRSCSTTVDLSFRLGAAKIFDMMPMLTSAVHLILAYFFLSPPVEIMWLSSKSSEDANWLNQDMASSLFATIPFTVTTVCMDLLLLLPLAIATTVAN